MFQRPLDYIVSHDKPFQTSYQGRNVPAAFNGEMQNFSLSQMLLCMLGLGRASNIWRFLLLDL